MTDDDYKIYKLLSIVACVITALFASCTMHTKYRIAQSIEKGVNPADANCALAMMNNMDCNIRAIK